MADKLTTIKVDDLDGKSLADETIEFGYAGQSYVIDLTKANADKFRAFIEKYSANARKAEGGRPAIAAPATPARRPAAKKAPAKKAAAKKVAAPSKNSRNGHRAKKAGKPDPTDVRAWAKDNGHVVGEFGRVPGAVTEAYLAATG